MMMCFTKQRESKDNPRGPGRMEADHHGSEPEPRKPALKTHMHGPNAKYLYVLQQRTPQLHSNTKHEANNAPGAPKLTHPAYLPPPAETPAADKHDPHTQKEMRTRGMEGNAGSGHGPASPLGRWG
ncbi:Hypothetical predicted protein [Pelobates cultripes]|uniref:Uncharacterized protein n=1 Tax=Pelobates cultripes TaxID=61616 RepID=A0AAD1SRZ2_PELCU|nr:Hypothetical predicted protein [Pelobates cultripes]